MDRTARWPLTVVVLGCLAAPLAADPGHTRDFVEIFNGGSVPLPMPNWILRLERTNSTGLKTTNVYHFPPNTIIDAGGHLVLVCSDKLRTPFP